MKNKWLDRRINTNALCYTLCTTEIQFREELKRLALPQNDWPSFLTTSHSNATTHFLYQSGTGAGHCAIVCLPLPSKAEKRTGIEIAGLLVHEAVHIWQEHCELIGEKTPSSEFEAYAVQTIAQELMVEYHRQVFKKDAAREPHD